MAFRVGRTDVIICDEIKDQKGYTLTQSYQLGKQ